MVISAAWNYRAPAGKQGRAGLKVLLQAL